ncbi:WXG100 family type VII secretion target [Amycolatopsis pigmentata]|uniref:WXG100 family type VII secretion target n=1 Tax=Amycolatopsis pigmentata TaxID=450801 RepID=A0ABW5FY77_9PSEU
MALPEPPPVLDPALESLDFDQLVQLINEAGPDTYYDGAQAFDNATARLQEIQDELRRENRNVGEAWQGRIADSFDRVVQEVSGTVMTVTQAMAGYGTALRRLGDALAQAQQRLRDLQTQNRRDVEAARQIMRDLGTVYQDIGSRVPPLPETVGAPPGVAGGAPGAPASPVAQGQAPAGAAPVPVAWGGMMAPGWGAMAPPPGWGGHTGEAFAGPAPAFASLGKPQPATQAVDTRHTGALQGVVTGEPMAPAPAVVGRQMPAVRRRDACEDEKETAGLAPAVLGRSQRTVASDVRRSPAKRKADKRADAVPAAEQHAADTEAPPVTVSHPAPETKAAISANVAAPEGTPAAVHVMSDPATATGATTPPVPATGTVPPSVAAANTGAPPAGAVPPPVPAAHTVSASHAAAIRPVGDPTAAGAAQEAARQIASGGLPQSGAPSTVPGGVPSVGTAHAGAPFQPVSGGLDADVPAGPPTAPGTAAMSRPGGTLAGSPGMGPMGFAGAHGAQQQQNERHPSGLLKAGPDAWEPGGELPMVLGRAPRRAEPPTEDDQMPPELPDLSRIAPLRSAEERLREKRS